MKKNDIKYNWDKMAIAYERFTNSPNSYSNMIEWPAIKQLTPDLEDKVIIDLGCGTGRFSFLFEDFKPKKIIGIDISDEMIRMAKDMAKEKNSQVSFIKNDIENLSSIETNSIDFAFSSTVLHYLEDLKAFMKEIYRILNPNGICILSVIHPVYSAQYPIKHENGEFPSDEEWEVKYLNKSIRSYIQPWIEYNSEIENFLSYSYHHTMSDYVNSIIEAGLSIKSFIEPSPPEQWKLSNEGRYYGFINTPTYGIFKIEK